MLLTYHNAFSQGIGNLPRKGRRIGKETTMNKTKQVGIGKIGFVFCAAVAGTLTGCVGYVDQPRGGGAYVEGPSVQVESRVVVQPEYVYYPDYGVYYSSH